MIRMYFNKTETNWLNWLPLAEFWYNSATHESIGKSPFEIVQERNPRNPVDVSIEVDWTAENAKTVEVIDDLLQSQVTWTIVDPKISWKNRDLTTTKKERKVKQKIGKAQ
jgi:hypothetical protein